MKKLLLAVAALLVAGCSPGETSDSTTTSATSTTASPTVTEPAPTTTAPPATTTTGATTTTAPSTTTSSLLAGNWASGPLVTTDFGALGWWDGTDWLDAETRGALPVVGGEDYQTIVLDSPGLTTAGPQTIVCEPLGLLGVQIADPGLLGEFPGPYGIAISAPWTLQPHLFEQISDDGTYATLAGEILADRGLDVANPVVKQLIRTDLEGDAVNEVLVVAEDVTPGFLMEVGDYSLVFMRRVIEGGVVVTAILEETVVLGEDQQYSGAHSVGTVADLNGDGKMEIVTNSAYFEGFGVSVWEYVDDDTGPVVRLQNGCGA
jgi:hypothetical protein